MNFRNLFYWMFGAISLLGGIVVASGIAAGGIPNITKLDSILGLVVSLLLIMFGGLLWIGVSVTASFKKEQ